MEFKLEVFFRRWGRSECSSCSTLERGDKPGVLLLTSTKPNSVQCNARKEHFWRLSLWMTLSLSLPPPPAHCIRVYNVGVGAVQLCVLCEDTSCEIRYNETLATSADEVWFEHCERFSYFCPTSSCFVFLGRIATPPLLMQHLVSAHSCSMWRVKSMAPIGCVETASRVVIVTRELGNAESGRAFLRSNHVPHPHPPCVIQRRDN